MQSHPAPRSYFSRLPSDLSTMTIDSASQDTRSPDGKSFAGVSAGKRSELSRSTVPSTPYGHNEFLLVFDTSSGANKLAYFLIDVSGRRKKLIPKQNTLLMNKVKDITDYSVVVMDNYLYLFGGKHVLGAVLRYCYRFNPENNQWRPLASMNLARARHTATALDGYIYVCGGEMRNGRFTDSLERFDPTTDSWTELRPMFSPRADHATVAAQNKIFVSGGIGNRSGANINFCYKLSGCTDLRPNSKCRKSEISDYRGLRVILIEGIWDRSHPDLERPRCRAGAIVLGHYIYLIGGHGLSGDRREPVIEYYNINRRKWQSEFRLTGDGYYNVECCVVRVPTTNKQFSTLGLTITKPWILW
ncbi:hypothetical protein LSH36_427g08037 [Paralvinella palmiformis]|uniref:Kelch repeat protein n=1 Tax=Paralvinella palmiformis TaxID=53620 RepID=A0AAD9JCS1_9ANNE|nr:hypothetical protein LSH36_427g08037 [Paralvinella palmiformis]